ncbi:IS66 family insertion sequence element accessory protein TnpB, partial [Shigella boydii]
MIWQPEFTDKTLSRKPGAVHTRIWLVAGITDMRKSFNGLGEQVQHVLNDNPFSGHLFIFRGR